jgi:hypothetical protein
MSKQREYYQTSAFYQAKIWRQRQNQELSANLLRVFADKNIHYIADFPCYQSSRYGRDQYAREAASLREKILYAVHRSSNTPVLQAKWAMTPLLCRWLLLKPASTWTSAARS